MANSLVKTQIEIPVQVKQILEAGAERYGQKFNDYVSTILLRQAEALDNKIKFEDLNIIEEALEYYQDVIDIEKQKMMV